MSGDAGAPDTLALFARFVTRTLGLHFSRERLPELRQKMTRLALESGFPSLDRYLLLVMSEPLSAERRAALIRTLTIGETYFLRDPKSYQIFTEHLLPGLIESRRGRDQSIRIWSAGCSSGEEPYSIAILLSRALPDLENWNVTLLATDINPDALERARSGIYGQWSFRNAPPWLMEYFSREPDGRYRIAPAIREMVTFRELNLAAPEAEEQSEATWGMDIIFCRNVMLYFGERQIERAMRRFHASLKENGRLFVGATEVNASQSEGFTLRQYEGAFLFCKSDPHAPVARKAALPPSSESAPPPLKVDPAPPPRPAQAEAPKQRHSFQAAKPAADAGKRSYPEAEELYRRGLYQEAAEAALALALAGERPAESLVLAARAFANIGQLDRARACCEQAIDCDRLSAPNHYLLSIILEQQGDTAAAVRCLKKAIFIDDDYLLAYFALGNLNRQSGDRREAERNFKNALRLLEKREPQEVVEEAEGMTAGVLAQMIRAGLAAKR